MTKQHRIIEALPFKISKINALKRFYFELNKKGWGITNKNIVLSCTKIYVPFYVFNVNVISEFKTNISIIERKNGSGRIKKQYISGHSENTYDSSSKETQIYGGYSYKRDLVDVLKCENLNEIKNLYNIPDQLYDTEFGVYAMHSNIARDYMIKSCLYSEKQRLKKWLFQNYDNIVMLPNIDLKCKFDYIYHTIYFPGYVIEFKRFGRVFRCFVNGYDGLKCTSLYHYSGLKVFLASMTSLIGATTWISLIDPMSIQLSTIFNPYYLQFITTLSGIAAISAQLFPIILQYYREKQRIREQYEGTLNRDEKKEKEHQKMHRKYEQRYQREKRRQQFKSWWYGTKNQQQQQQQDKKIWDPLKYYTRLNVPKDAKLELIQKNFRKLAMKWHPDMHQNSNDKKIANEKFREILKAYQILRDPVKRSHYDSTF